jgi:4-hydroxy-3-polyprenylbenzoate decarboxylase
MESKIIIVGISGASGAAYAQRLLKHLAGAECEIHLVCSSLGRRLLAEELGVGKLDPDQLTDGRGGLLTVHQDGDLGGPLASGSFRHDGMVVVPCSGNSLSKIAYGMTDNQLQRAAMVTLKERRRLILAHRETPLSLTEIEAMRAATLAGAIVLPLSPGFYLQPKSIDDLLDFMAGRIMDLLGVPHDLAVRWDEKLAADRAVRPKNKQTGPVV